MRKRSFFIAMVLILIGIIGLAGCNSKPSSTAPVTRANPTANRELGFFSHVEGTTYLFAGLYAKEEGGFLKKIESEGYGSGSGYNSAVNNYVFFNTVDDSTHRLLPHNDSLILRAQRFPEKDKKDKVDWFVYDVVKSDTNSDKELSYKDLFTIAVSDSGGNDYVELISNVETRMGHSMTDANTLLVLYIKDSKKYYSRIDLPNKKVNVTNELPSLGSDVK